MPISLRRFVLPCSVLLISGCTLCASPDDYSYSAFGGRWQRHDMANGRVGSAFEPGGGEVTVEQLAPFEAAPEPSTAPGEPEEQIGGQATHSILR